MQLTIEKPFEDHVNKVLRFASTAPYGEGAIRVLGGSSLIMGRETTPGYEVPGEAVENVAYVGDSHWIRGTNQSKEVEALFKVNRELVGMKFRYSDSHKGFVIDVVKKNKNGMTTDSVGNIINGSLLSPNAIAYFREVFMQPLAYSNARKLVSIEQGTNPWAEVMELVSAFYSGNGQINTAGSVDNTMSTDVEVQSGLLAQPIINMMLSWRFSVSELERAKVQSGFPFAGSLITQKPAYAKWLMDLLTDSLIYFGNSVGGTLGLFDINNVTVWTSVGSNQTLSTILADGSNLAKGNEAYVQLATAITSFMTTLQNKPSKIVVGMSVPAYNALMGPLTYSNVYNPQSVLKTFVENFMAGEGQEGTSPSNEFFPDPLLNANTQFNSTSHDYLVISAPELGTGVADKPQKLLQFGMPLEDFVYPVVPGSNATHYQMLRRVSGVFAPLSTAVKVYSTY